MFKEGHREHRSLKAPDNNLIRAFEGLIYVVKWHLFVGHFIVVRDAKGVVNDSASCAK